MRYIIDLKRDTIHSVFFAVVLFIVTAFSVLFIATPQVNAAAWDAGNIIDDVTFTNAGSMDRASIQNFLNSKVPTCETNHARGGGQNDPGPPYTCLKNYSEGGRSSAQIIFDTAQQYQINPQVLIVLLQKEQGLVTDTWPWPIQYKTATGYGCPDTAPCDSQYYGLTNQLNWSAKMFRAIMNASPDWYTPYITGNNFIQYNPQSSCGGSTVSIKNRPTQALYNYTPYQPNQSALAAGYGAAPPCGAYGNRNFYLYFNDWFGSAQSAGKWLRQGPDGQVWLITEGLMPNGSYAQKKFKLTSWDIYLAYFLQYEPIVPVSYEYLAQYIDDGVLTTRTIGRSYNEIQFVNNGYRYYVPDGATCDAWGFDCFNTNKTKTIPGTQFLERLTGTGKPVPPVMVRGGVAYKLQNGTKLPILNGETFSDLGYSWDNIIYDTQAINASQPLGSPQISRQAVVQFSQSSPVVVYDPSTYKFHNVPNYDVFSAWNMQQYANLKPADSTYTASPPATSAPNISIWASDGNGKKYLVDQGRKIDVTAVVGLPNVTWETTAKDLLNKLPTAAYGKYVWIQQTGAVYAIENGQKRIVPNWDTFVSLGLTIGQLLPISPYTASQIPDGPFNLADGSLFEDSSGVWLVSAQQKFHVPSWNYFAHFVVDPNKRITGQSNLSAAYTGSAELSVLVKDSSSNLYVLQNGKRISVSSSTASSWGLNASSFIMMSDTFLSRLPVSANLGSFAYSNTNGLYYGSGGQKHHIDSYQSYQNLGGTAGNTFMFESDFFIASPSGNSIP